MRKFKKLFVNHLKNKKMKKATNLEVLKAKALPARELKKVFGGDYTAPKPDDSVDCNSELSSNGNTTDSEY